MVADNGDDHQYVQTNIAVWVLTGVSAAFLFVRLYCRLRFSKVWWDDLVLTTSWVCHQPGPDFKGQNETPLLTYLSRCCSWSRAHS